MRIVLVVSILFSAAAARAESVYQLQVGLSSGFTGFNGGAYVVNPSIGVGIEDDASVWLLQLGGFVSHGERFTGSHPLSDGTIVYETVTQTSVSASLSPGYRRYLTGFESGFAPLVEFSLLIGAAHDTFDFALGNGGATTLELGGSAGVGGEVRFGDHFAINARVYASLIGSRYSGGANVPVLYSESLGVGAATNLILRF